MSVTLKHLYTDDNNPFRLRPVAGLNGMGNVVNWIYMMEDEYIIDYFQGSELAVTTGMHQSSDENWLLTVVKHLHESHASGLIVNAGKYIFDIPAPVLDFCNQKDFPLLVMPWEIHITDMIQNFCISIMENQQESALHDKAVKDAILRHDNVEEYKEILSSYYDLEADFVIVTICARYKEDSPLEGDYRLPISMEYWLETRLRRMKKRLDAPTLRMGIVTVDQLQLLILNRPTPALRKSVLKVILDSYQELRRTCDIYVGVGQVVQGIDQLYKSFLRATTAMRMAIHKKQTIINFDEMGFDKLLFSVNDEQVLSSYADEILGPVERYDAQGHEYMKLLRSYIRNDRSLSATADELFVHRNTVNYQLQKLRALLNSPLKTAEDLFPIQVALAIRDM